MQQQPDPVFATVLADNPPPGDVDGIEAKRAWLSKLFGLVGGQTHPVTAHRVMITSGDSAIGCSVLRPVEGPKSRAAIIFYHGGGFCALSSADYHDVTSALAALSGAAVYVPDYRLAPEHPFPAAHDDALAVFRWVLENAKSEEIDDAQVAVAGDSAGGNLAASVCIAARDEGLRPPSQQVLFYPLTDCAGAFPARDRYSIFLDKGEIDASIAAYGAPPLDPRSSPLRCTDLRGLPPCVIFSASHDPLCDDAVAYAERLSLAGNKVDLFCYQRMAHTFLNWSGVCEEARLALSHAAACLRVAAESSSGE